MRGGAGVSQHRRVPWDALQVSDLYPRYRGGGGGTRCRAADQTIVGSSSCEVGASLLADCHLIATRNGKDRS
jgi:hypothetical protein